MTMHWKTNVHGDGWWECDTCRYNTLSEEDATDHSVACGVNPEKPVVVPGLAEMLDGYRRRVEAEVLDLLVQNLEATGAAYLREGDSAEAGKYEDAAWIVTEHRKEWIEGGE